MSKKNFGAALQHTVEQQDASLKKRFEVADSLLMSAPASELKARATHQTKENTSRSLKSPALVADLVVRDTFSMPANNYEIIDRVRNKVAKEGLIYTRSEIVRAGLLAIGSMSINDLLHLLGSVERMKPGRKT
jgi:hypothetical protein